jgi:hypothetical protein
VKKFVVEMPSSALIFTAQRLVAVPESIHQHETKATIGVTVVLNSTKVQKGWGGALLTTGRI